MTATYATDVFAALDGYGSYRGGDRAATGASRVSVPRPTPTIRHSRKSDRRASRQQPRIRHAHQSGHAAGGGKLTKSLTSSPARKRSLRRPRSTGPRVESALFESAALVKSV